MNMKKLDNYRNIILISFFLLIFIVVVFYFATKDYGHKALYKKFDYFYGDKFFNIGSNNIKDSEEGIMYSYSVWIRTDNVSANGNWNTDINIPKVVIFNHGAPNIVYIRKTNTMEIQFAYKDDDGLVDTYNFELSNFETQVWVNLAMTVNNRKVNIYKNGVILTSKLLPNIHFKTKKVLSIGEKDNNFNGYIGYLDYFNYVLNPDQVMKLYHKRKSKLPNKLKNFRQYEKIKDKKSFISNIKENILKVKKGV